MVKKHKNRSGALYDLYYKVDLAVGGVCSPWRASPVMHTGLMWTAEENAHLLCGMRWERRVPTSWQGTDFSTEDKNCQGSEHSVGRQWTQLLRYCL